MSSKILDFYIYAFSHLNTNKNKSFGVAPHKPVLLLSILQAFEARLITGNQICITPELVEIFKNYWYLLVSTNHKLGFTLPFYHLRSEKGDWWELVPNPGYELWLTNIGSTNSFSSLSAAVAYAQIDPNLASLLKSNDSRRILQQVLLNTYFPGKKLDLSHYPSRYLSEIKREMLEEPPSEYQSHLKHLKTKLDPETYQIEVYARDTIFRREIIRLYNDTCCITNIRVSASYSFSMVDACHIIPFHKTFNNHPTNGVSLCPNLHRAFDKGTISIDENYKVIVSSRFVENEEALYSLKNLAGLPILLPKENKFYPDKDNLAWHRKNVFKE
jgi:putative restriction endonuclease